MPGNRARGRRGEGKERKGFVGRADEQIMDDIRCGYGYIVFSSLWKNNKSEHFQFSGQLASEIVVCFNYYYK